MVITKESNRVFELFNFVSMNHVDPFQLFFCDQQKIKISSYEFKKVKNCIFFTSSNITGGQNVIIWTYSKKRNLTSKAPHYLYTKTLFHYLLF